MPEWRNWYTHTTQNRASKDMRVQVSPPAQMKKIVVILGPTATGKSELAVELAQKFNGEVVSADSRQVYTGLDIGTGKITEKEMGGIPHHMLDATSPKKVFTVTEWKKMADLKIADILSRGKLPIVCGGTGFYIQSIVDNFVLPEVPPNPKLRKRLENKTVAELFKILKKLDAKRAQTIDKNNPMRLIRAIEIATSLGQVPKIKKERNPYQILQIGLTLPDSTLQKKIHDRVISRMKKGMIREAENLHANGLTFKRMHSLGLEYRLLADYLEWKLTRKEFIQKLETEIWQYAKRQMTWFKRDKKIHWFHPRETGKITQEVAKFLQK